MLGTKIMKRKKRENLTKPNKHSREKKFYNKLMNKRVSVNNKQILNIQKS